MVDQAPRIFTETDPRDIAREAELLALRAMSDNIAALTREVTGSREVMSQLQIDMALVKERQGGTIQLKDNLEKLELRLNLVEARNNKQDGAMSFASWLKDFGPWLVAVAAGAWAILSGRAG